MRKLILFFPFLFIISGSIQAQSPGMPKKVQGPDPAGIITGRIIEKDTREILPYTNVVLYSHRDSTMVSGTIAEEDGSFKLEKIPYGLFYIDIKFIGYDKKTIPRLVIRPDNMEINLEDIELSRSSQQLDEVKVTAERSPVEYKIDRKVIRVSENLTTQGESAARALENAPSVTVDIDGNVLLRGSSNFTVLIDGKPSPLEGSDALKQIPASAVENIEIITNPSAKYDPDGLSGIINVITRKRALDGFSGIVNASLGTNEKYRADLLLNYKMDKLSYYFGADYNDENRLGKLSRTMITEGPDTTTYIVSDGNGGHGHDGYTFKGGVTYDLNTKNSISVEGSLGQHGGSRTINDNFEEYTVPGEESLYYISESSDRRSEDFYNLIVNYSRIFDSKDHNLSTYLNFEHEKGGSEEYQNQWFTDPDWKLTDDNPYRIYSTEDSKGFGLRYQLDYIRPVFNTGKIETGYQVRLDKVDEAYNFNEWDEQTGDWVDNPDFSSSMDFWRNIQAAYGMFSSEWELISLQAGLRGEYTYRRVEHLMSETPSVINRLDIFPTVHLARKIGEKDQVLASYGRRINRPRGYFLDPFPNYMDPNNLRMGNPELQPEYVNSYEMSYQKGIAKSSFISLEGYYRQTNNSITRVMSLREDGMRIHTMENLNQEHALGAELMINFLVVKWFNFNASTNYYHYRLEGNLSDNGVSATSNNYDARINTNFRITPTTRLQIQGFYQGPSVTAQGKREDFLMTNAAIRQDLFGEKLTASLQIQDIFGTGSFRFISEGNSFYDEYNFRRESQVVRLALSFRINNYKKNNGERGDSNGGGDSDAIMNY